MLNPGFILAYHGCSSRVAAGILSNKIRHLSISDSDNEWLGDGVYFWENSFERAMLWAQERVKKPDKPAVIGAIIIPGNCLDLTDSSSLCDLKTVVPFYEETMKTFELDIPHNRDLKHSFDCALIKFYHLYRKIKKKAQINTVRAPFIEGKAIAAYGCSFCEKNHIQWAVRTPSKSIIGYFVPKKHAQPALDAALKLL